MVTCQADVSQPQGDVIAEIETDKATMEVESVDEGTVAKLLVEAGTEGVKVNEVIAVLAEDGEDASNVDVSAVSDAATPATPAAEETPKVEASAPSTPSAAPAAPAPATSGERVFASPLARRIAQQNGVEIAALKGSGPHGRIVKADVEAAMASGTVPQTVASAAASATPTIAPQMATGPSDDAVRALFEEGSFEAKPHDGKRKTIAKRLTESAQTIPAYLVTMEAEIEAL